MLTFTPAPSGQTRRPSLQQAASGPPSTAPQPSWETRTTVARPRVSLQSTTHRGPERPGFEVHSPLVKGSIFPPLRLLIAGAPELPTPRAEAAPLTEHAQRGLEGCRGGAAWGGAAPPFRVFASAAERAREAGAQTFSSTFGRLQGEAGKERQGRGQSEPRPAPSRSASGRSVP